jgi:hypothetical protein
MARLARALYARGLDPPNVLFECYGVGFPAEFFAVAAQRTMTPRLLVSFTDQPWGIAVPPSEGGPPDIGRGQDPALQRILTADPDLMPLMEFGPVGHSRHGVTVCYRLSMLADDRTDVYAFTGRRGPVVRYGDSLLDVLYAHHVKHLRWNEWYVEQPWNYGIEWMSDREVDEARALVERIESIQRRIASEERA